MELKEFIKTALIDIVEAIEQAKLELYSRADYICPLINPHDSNNFKVARTHSGMYYQEIEFDIAVTAESTTSSGGKAGLKVLGLEAKLGNDLVSNSTSVSRIKFHVPLGLPSKK